MPMIHYCRCERPLSVESDRLRRIVREHQIDYAIYDSIAFACDGPPEAAEVASRYFRAVREINCGSFHIAHVSKGEHSDQKPFGSAFWHNGARSTWFVQSAERAGEQHVLRLGFFNRKANLGPIQSPVSLIVRFSADRTEFQRAEITDTPDFEEKLTVRQKMIYLLRRGARTQAEIASQINAKADTVRKTINRAKEVFIELNDGRIGLKGHAE
jgi:Sigma-70, region 4